MELVSWSGEVVHNLYPSTPLFVRVWLSRRITHCGYLLRAWILCCAHHTIPSPPPLKPCHVQHQVVMRVDSSAHCGDACSRPQHMEVRYISNRHSGRIVIDTFSVQTLTFKFVALDIWIRGVPDFGHSCEQLPFRCPCASDGLCFW